MSAPGETGITLIQVHNRIYRKAQIEEKIDNDDKTNADQDLPQQTDISAIAEDEVDYVIERVGDSYVTKMPVPSVFYKFIIGKKGAVKNRIQNETGSFLNIPNHTSGSSEIVIKGPSEKCVINARTRVEIIKEQSMKLIEPTHFISIPLNSQEIQESVRKFLASLKKKYIQEEKVQGLEESIFMPVQRLHLTIFMLHLLSNEDISKARKLLNNIQSQVYDILKTRTLMIRLKGLDIMNDDPSSVDVLYGKVQEIGGENRLEKMCKILVEAFEKEDLIPHQERDVKVHFTLLNTRYRSTNRTETNQTRIPFDATKLLKEFDNIDLGEHRVSAIHLSQRNEFDKDGFYYCCGSIHLP